MSNKQIVKLIEERLELGKREYTEQLDVNDGRDWLQEALEEALDLCVYLTAEMQKRKDMNRPTITNIKKIFSEAGVQLGTQSINMIEKEMVFLAERMAKRCVQGNLKRLTPELFWVAMGRENGSSD